MVTFLERRNRAAAKEKTRAEKVSLLALPLSALHSSARDWIRTSTSLRTLRPEHSASTSFATRALSWIPRSGGANIVIEFENATKEKKSFFLHLYGHKAAAPECAVVHTAQHFKTAVGRYVAYIFCGYK